MAKRTLATLLVAATLTIATIGCGADRDKPELGAVRGTVTYKGQPLTSGSVVFVPAAGKGSESSQVASGNIQSDGSYRLTTFNTNDGAVLGQHIVTVQSRQETTFTPPKPGEPIQYVLPKSEIPSKYENPDTSPLRNTVEAGSNTINIELED